MTVQLLLILQGVFFAVSFAEECQLRRICDTLGTRTTVVDPFATELPVTAQCSGPDASSSLWYIRRYEDGSDSLDGLGIPLTLNNSFNQIGNQLEILNVNGFAEGMYRCGVNITSMQPASLCLFVRGQPVFISCPGEYEACPSVTNITATESSNVSLDTRIEFVDGGFCQFTKRIRHLIVTKGRERVYLCSNLTTFINQLCEDNDMFRVELQQSCTPPDITFCKYDMILVLLDFDESDEGVYNVEVTFENDHFGRGTLTRQFSLVTGSFTTTSFITTSSTTSSIPSTASVIPGDDGLSGGAVVGIVIAVIVFFIITGALLLCYILGRIRNIKDWLAEQTKKRNDVRFFKAVSCGDRATVVDMIQKGSDVNALNEKGETALIVASKKSDCKMILELLENGAQSSIDETNEQEMSPLIIAVLEGFTEVVELLLNKGAKVDVTYKYNDSKGSSLLMIASSKRFTEVVKLLLKKGDKVDMRRNDALMIASSNGFTEVVQVILKHSDDLDLRKASNGAGNSVVANILDKAPRIIKISSPFALAVYKDGIIIVGDSDEHVNVYSKEPLKKIMAFKLEGKDPPIPRGVVTNGEVIFITDIKNGVAVYNFAGEWINSCEMKGCHGIAINTTMKRVYVANRTNNSIEVLDYNLRKLFSFSKDFNDPCSVAVSVSGTVYITDTLNDRIMVFTANGKYITEFGSCVLSSPKGICIDSNDNILIADTERRTECRVCVFNSKRKLLKYLGESGRKRGEFSSVYGVAVDSGKIYVPDYDGHRVQIFPSQIR